VCPLSFKGGFIIKERILSAFLELSKTKGFYRVTMDELAAEAGMSKRTLYRYFSSKDQIIEATLDRFMTEMAFKVEELVSACHKPEEIFANMLSLLYHAGRTIINPLVLEDLRQHYPHYWRKIDEFRIKRAEDIINAILLSNYDKNQDYTRELDARIVTKAVLASVQAVANPEFIITNGFTFEYTIKQLMDFFQYGLIKRD